MIKSNSWLDKPFPTGLEWLDEAYKYIGQHEIKGAKTNSFIAIWLKLLNAAWHDDETPWCGTFVAHCVKSANLPIPKNWMRARDWLTVGTTILKPCVGAIVVFSRDGGGHVGFVVGLDKYGNLMVLGGNQGDCVRISAFSFDRVVGYRWPSKWPKPERYRLPILNGDGTLSKNEA